MSWETVSYQVEDGVAVVSLNRPEVVNAINEQLGQDLYAAMKQVDADESVKVAVLTGTGRGFCAGQDLSDATAVKGELHLANSVRDRYNPLLAKMNTLRVPLLAAVNGAAAGAGFGLALACDVRFASTTAKFTMAFSKIGLVPDSASSYFLPRLVGLGKALELAWTGDVLDAGQALRLGIVNAVYEPDELLPQVMAFAERLAHGPTVALRLTKELMHENFFASLPEALEREAAFQEVAGRSHDFREGVQAFLEKRQPRYRGN